MKRLFVANIPYTADLDQLEQCFAAFGTVRRFDMISDKRTGDFRGFGFIEMDDAPADEAIDKLHGVKFCSRVLAVNEAQPKGEFKGGGRPNGRRRTG